MTKNTCIIEIQVHSYTFPSFDKVGDMESQQISSPALSTLGIDLDSAIDFMEPRCLWEIMPLLVGLLASRLGPGLGFGSLVFGSNFAQYFSS